MSSGPTSAFHQGTRGPQVSSPTGLNPPDGLTTHDPAGLELYAPNTLDDAILFAADEDYVPLVEAVKRDGRRVIHAFLDVPTHGRRLREACDDWRVVILDDLRATVPGGVRDDDQPIGRD